MRVDEFGRAAPGVWALGDVSSPYELKHVANAEARCLAHNLAHPDDLRPYPHDWVPAAVFTEPAAPRNAERLSRESQIASEQPGCVHASMDIYKWAYKLGPLVHSGLVADCLELAAAARELDMRASPYDLTGYGFAPIAVETPTGRAEYVRGQQDVADRAAPLREDLSGWCRRLLEIAGDHGR